MELTPDAERLRAAVNDDPVLDPRARQDRLARALAEHPDPTLRRVATVLADPRTRPVELLADDSFRDLMRETQRRVRRMDPDQLRQALLRGSPPPATDTSCRRLTR